MKYKEDAKSFIFAVALVLGFHSFLYKPFNIPSESMTPSLLIGDYLFVSKFTYGYSKYSFPFGLPIMSGRVLYKPPVRGDVVVFRVFSVPGRQQKPIFQSDSGFESEDWVKRVVGMPGDKIQMKGGRLFINDVRCELEEVGPYQWKGQKGEEYNSTQYYETLPNGVKHPILKTDEFGEGKFDNTPEFIVPAGHFFMMGDNRDHSGDSRVIGFVPEENLVGRVEILFFSTGIPTTPGGGWWQFWKWPTETRYDRIFNLIK